jgi:gliding motility-associated-like protein
VLQIKNLVTSFVALIILTSAPALNAQPCVDNYFALTYTAPTDVQLSNSLLTRSDQLVSCGKLQKKAGQNGFSNGWIAKFTANGSVLWSKSYGFPEYTSTVFEDLAQAADDSYWVVGEGYDSLQGNGGLQRLIGVIIHIDTYGNVIRSHVSDISFLPTELVRFQHISKTDDGDFLIHGTITYTDAILLKLMTIRMDASGNIKWITRVASPNNSLGLGLNTCVAQHNNQVVLGAYVLEREPPLFNIFKEGYLFAGLDYATGHLLWNKTYAYFLNPAGLNVGELVPAMGISDISWLPGGNISFQTSFSDSVLFQGIPGTRRSLNIVTDASGNLVDALAYENNKPGCATVDASADANNGSQYLLMDDGQKSIFVGIDQNGQVTNEVGYNHFATNMAPACLLNTTANGSYIFLNNRNNSRSVSVIKTVADHRIACADAPTKMIVSDATAALKNYQSAITSTGTDGTIFTFPSIPMLKEDYPLAINEDCRKACCTDVSDTAATINLCDLSSYTLPDNNVIKESGTYYVMYKTSKGCDSIRYLPVEFLQRPAVEITGERCLEGKDSIVLDAIGYYASYNWMNGPSTQPAFAVKAPGIYWVEVANACGISRDSIEVFDKCDFGIYMPNAFTPNGDNLNETFGVSTFNLNRLTSLSIYNRAGQLLFETTDKAKKWDGTFRHKLQPAGVYVYQLRMETLDGKALSKKGTVQLIR